MDTSNSKSALGLKVIALGGHSLLDPDHPPTVESQFEVTARAMAPIADLIVQGHRVVITHGNGPQVGFMQLRSELASQQVHRVPLDSLVADSQGSLGYMIQRTLRQELGLRGSNARVVTLVTEVVVDRTDRAFSEPTKPIGRFYTQEEAQSLGVAHGWTLVEDAGRGYRRVVPSPGPVEIVQIEVISQLVAQGVVVICCGGGGIPVTQDSAGEHRGLEAVIDKDRTSALLAVALGADELLITTAVDAVYRDFQSPERVPLPEVGIRELQALAAQGQFPAGSMGPKVEAALYFLDRGGEAARICHSEQVVQACANQAGTRIFKEPT